MFLGDFNVTVESSNLNIQSISYNASKTRTIVIELEDNLLFNQKILITYSGDKIKSKNGKNLDKFSNMEVLNSLEPRYVLPAKIEAEDYVNMLGIS